MIVVMLAILFGVVAISPLTAYAASGTRAGNDPYVVTTYAELRDLMANAPTDGTTRYIKLGGDITENDIQNDHSLTLTQEGQNVVLDLAGYKITRNSTITVDKGVIRAKKGTADQFGQPPIYIGPIDSFHKQFFFDFAYDCENLGQPRLFNLYNLIMHS